MSQCNLYIISFGCAKKIANVQNSTCLDMAGLTCVLLKFAPVKSFSLELILDSWPKKDAIREDEFVNASSCEIFCNTEFAYFLWEKIFTRALLRESQNPTVIVVYMYTCLENYPYTYSFMFCYLASREESALYDIDKLSL